MRVALAVRGVVSAVIVALFAAAAGYVPLVPALALAVMATAALAGEALIAAVSRASTSRPSSPARVREALVDTSALIDGRLPDVAASGFLDLDLVVPEFVLHELQHVADASEPMRRARGRRGLDVLAALRASEKIALEVVADDVAEQRDVDLKLVELAVRRKSALITTDFNLNKVAGIRGVVVLNVNDLAHALRPVVLPGEAMRVAIVKEGKEPGQGVAYLEDGTMVVVDHAKALVGQTVEVVVTSAIQTAAGKMFFAKLA
jgi:uncharacterized protein YacL